MRIQIQQLFNGNHAHSHFCFFCHTDMHRVTTWKGIARLMKTTDNGWGKRLRFECETDARTMGAYQNRDDEWVIAKPEFSGVVDVEFRRGEEC